MLPAWDSSEVVGPMSTDETSPGSPRPSQARELARDLTGDLPCSRCRYNLRGMSVRAACPECGLPVRTTILVLVDPRADELIPLTRPRLTASGVVVWIGGATGAALGVWALRIAEWLDAQYQITWATSDIAWGSLIMLALSAIGALALIRPHPSVPLGRSVLAVLGVLLYAPLAFVFHRIHLVIDAGNAHPYAGIDASLDERTTWRLAFAVVAMLLVLSLRPAGRQLAARSFIFRSGQIDRQSMLAMIGAFAVGAAGDVIRLIFSPTPGDWLSLLSLSLISLGGFLLTMGLFAALVDGFRLRAVLANEQIKLAHILESNAARERRTSEPGP
ncbi:MAG: hypothetical protein RIB60_08840 [Phycisphaerales bacterium]